MEEDLIKQRLAKADQLQKEGFNPYGIKFDKPCSIKDLVDKFQEGKAVSTAGRLTAMRSHGKSTFCDLRDSTGRIQLYLKEGTLSEPHAKQFSQVDIGDIVGIKGEFFKTKTGEATVNVKEFFVLSKALRSLPEKWHGLKDVETRYRQRYLDLISNENARKIFYLRSAIISKLRQFLDGNGFLEVETPMMQAIPGGATARPFITHHTALDIDLYLRIAPELYLKRLLVGGFDKVYELNRNFRNEGLSTKHNPEFTMVEVYAAFWDYADMMNFTETMISDLAQLMLGGTEIPYKDTKINLTKPFKRIALYDILKEHTGIDFSQNQDMRKLAKEHGVEVQVGQGESEILNNFFEKFVEPKLIEPTFIIDYPAALCPLAKCKKDNPELTERFELFIGTRELANAYSELNDPTEQRQRFEGQKTQKGKENEAAIDEDFLRALEYGMPPASGLGIGIDRLVMLFTNQDSIKDVILFPQLRPEATQ
ncbi:MAG: lysine--tRNA ligase [Candidatus Omnitrophota bacterium]